MILIALYMCSLTGKHIAAHNRHMSRYSDIDEGMDEAVYEDAATAGDQEAAEATPEEGGNGS